MRLGAGTAREFVSVPHKYHVSCQDDVPNMRLNMNIRRCGIITTVTTFHQTKMPQKFTIIDAFHNEHKLYKSIEKSLIHQFEKKDGKTSYKNTDLVWQGTDTSPPKKI